MKWATIDDLEKSISDLMEQAGIDAQAPPALRTMRPIRESSSTGDEGGITLYRKSLEQLLKVLYEVFHLAVKL